MMRVALVGALALTLVSGAPITARAQGASQPVVVVDVAQVLRESAAAQALRELEFAERRALRSALDAVKESLELEEAELAELKGELPADQFEIRVRAFDDRVRQARRAAQEQAESLRGRYQAAGEALRSAVDPLLSALMSEIGATVAIGRGAALMAAPDADVTDALIARLNIAQPASTAAELLPPVPANEENADPVQ